MKVKIKSREGRKMKSCEKASFFYYINPKNVSSVIEMYGYAYSIKNTILVYLAVIAAACVMGFVFRLPPGYVAVVAMAGIFYAPKIIINSYRGMYEQKRFSDVNIYIEQMLYSFRKNPIILTALQDAGRAIAKDSPMKEVIERAIEHIKYDLESDHAYEEGLKIIEEAYKCQRIRDAHRLMLKVNSNAGDYKNSTKVILMNRRGWETQTCKHQKECKARQKMVEIALGIVCLTTTITPLLINAQLQEIQMTDYMLYRIGTVVMLVMCIIVYAKTDRLATINWLDSESELSPEEQVALYEKVEYFDFQQERKKSIRWTGAPLACFVVFFFLKWKIPMLAMIPVAVLTLNQHKAGYALAKKKLVREINRAFPQWLMEMSLLLQTTPNVHAAIHKSIADAPPVLVPALQKMERELDENPESNEPYCNFLRSYNYMDISSAMGMLYSISHGGGGDADHQIEEILEKNVVLLEQMEEMQNEKRIASMQMQILLPSLIGGFKFLIDMVLILLAFPSMNFL